MKKLLDDKKKELLVLIEKIQIKHGWTQGQIAEKVGYTPNYLSEALSKNIISNKLIRALRGLLEGKETGTLVLDAGAMIINNQVQLIATSRVTLSLFAEIQSLLMKEKMLPTQLLNIYQTMVKDAEEQVRKELGLK